MFTNLSQDHLDYHASMEEYFRAKARLFTVAMSDRAVVNIDASEGRLLTDSGLPTITYGVAADADDFHVESLSQLREAPADAAEADDDERLAAKFHTRKGLLLPFFVLHGGSCLVEGARQHEHIADRQLSDGLAHERAAFFALFDTDDQAEGMAAFTEKRPPVWSGR